jgi:hypothetical protein
MAVACDEDRVIAVAVTEGQRHDASLTEPLLAEAAGSLDGFDEVLGDEAYDSDTIRVAILDDLDDLPVIPSACFIGL